MPNDDSIDRLGKLLPEVGGVHICRRQDRLSGIRPRPDVVVVPSRDRSLCPGNSGSQRAPSEDSFREVSKLKHTRTAGKGRHEFTSRGPGSRGESLLTQYKMSTSSAANGQLSGQNGWIIARLGLSAKLLSRSPACATERVILSPCKTPGRTVQEASSQHLRSHWRGGRGGALGFA